MKTRKVSKRKVTKRRPSPNKARKTNRQRKQYKEKSSIKRKMFVLLIFGIIIVALYYITPDCIEFNVQLTEQQEDKIRSIVREEIENVNDNKASENEVSVVEGTDEDNGEGITEEVSQVQQTESVKVTSRGGTLERTSETKADNSLTGYRITSYYPGDGCASTNKTGSGKTTADFGTKTVSGKTVYTYNEMIVVAAATYELKNTGYSTKGAQESQVKHYFHYYDTLEIEIDGNLYKAIVLDSCGAAMWKGQYRIDIYVPNSSNVINRSNVTAYFNA